jgi:hypothetical protein
VPVRQYIRLDRKDTDRKKDKYYASLAQLVEQLTLNQWVRGSNPRRCTIEFKLYLLEKVNAEV